MEATTFEALGTYVHLATRQDHLLPALRGLAETILADVDRTCSRFRADSDLMLVNRNAGRWVEVDPLLVRAVETAVDAARQTDGLVNPLLGRPLQQLGYDRDFAAVVELDDDVIAPATPPPLDAWSAIRLDAGGALVIPAGTALDLGATAKAWAADIIAAAAAGELEAEAIVSLGGDIAIADTGSPAEPWPIAISTFPGQPAEAIITLDRGGLATSSTRVRRWARRGVQLHHVLDPRTGLPAPTTWRTVTATGRSATAANIASTAAIVLGEQAPAWLEQRGVDARLVAADGGIQTVGAWPTDTEVARPAT